MPEVQRTPKNRDGFGREIVSIDDLSPREKARLAHQGQWVVWNEAQDEILAKADNFESVFAIASQLRAASPRGKGRFVAEFIEPIPKLEDWVKP